MKPSRIEQKGAVTRVWYDDCVGGQEFKFMLSSDRHHDSLGCQRDVEKRHLDEAVETDAMIIDAGDLFDAMQGKFDPRRSYDDLRQEFKVKHYYDAVSDDAIEFYEPYAANLLVIGKGNHESAVLDKTNIDLTSRLVYGLKNKTGANIQTGYYGGWIIFNFAHGSGGSRCSFKYRYHHGKGGSAPVTRGVLDTNRQAVYLPDGHNHQAYALPIKRERITTQGTIYPDVCWFVRTPGYKYEFANGDSWATEKMFAPTPIGCVWMSLKYSTKTNKSKARISCRLTQDIE